MHVIWLLSNENLQHQVCSRDFLQHQPFFYFPVTGWKDRVKVAFLYLRLISLRHIVCHFV